MNKPEVTQMTAPQGGEKLVKIKAIRPIRVRMASGEQQVVTEGQEVEVTEDQAKEICDKPSRGGYAFGGERFDADGEVRRHKIIRAVRV